MWLQRLGVAKAALLLAVLGAQAEQQVCLWQVATKSGQPLGYKVPDVPILCLVPDVGINLWGWV